VNAQADIILEPLDPECNRKKPVLSSMEDETAGKVLLLASHKRIRESSADVTPLPGLDSFLFQNSLHDSMAWAHGCPRAFGIHNWMHQMLITCMNRPFRCRHASLSET